MAQVKDPVCGMEIDSEKAAATATHEGKTYYFCSAMCKTKFGMNPAQYTKGDSEAHHGHHHG